MPVDLRSDTVTKPTPEMLKAMTEAPVGDDVLGDDPTVIELEALAAKEMNMEAGLFVPSGTMGNQIALAAHTQPGDSVIFDEESHMVYYEVGAPGVIAGVVCRTIESQRGIMAPEAIERRILTGSLHTPGTTLLCLENTHNRSGGTVLPPEMMAAYRDIADRHAIRIHVDGARIYNAAAALGLPVRDVVRGADTITFCLSKALGAPVGSVLCGTAAFIEKARVWRKRLGGGMRQAGLLAAAGIYGIHHIAPKLGEDHARARKLATLLQDLPGACVDLDLVVTNFVMVDTDRPSSIWIEALEKHGMLTLPPGPNRIRLVFHHQVRDEDVEPIATAFRAVARELAS